MRNNLNQAQTELDNSKAQVATLKDEIMKKNLIIGNFEEMKRRVLEIFNCFISGNVEACETKVYTVTKSSETINKVRERYPYLTLKSIQRDNKALQIVQSIKIKRGDVVIFEKTPGSSNGCIHKVSTVTQELKSNPQ